MTPLLVLLALLSAATLASRRGAFGEIVGGAATPVLVLFGLALSPRGLGFLAPSVVEGLAPALAVGVAWLGLVAGLRVAAAIAHEPVDRRVFLPLVSTATAALLLFVATHLLPAGAVGHIDVGVPVTDGTTFVTTLVALAFLAGACLGAPSATGSEARYARAVALLCAGAALCLAAPLSMALALGLGLVGGVVVWLVSGQDKTAAVVALLGVVTLVAGLSALLHIPGVLAGVVVGAVLSRLDVGRTLWPIADRSERPVRIVVTVILAASADVDLTALILGSALGVGALVATALTLGPSNAARAGALGSSSLALALLASFSTAGVGQPLVAAVLIAVALVDAVALAVALALKSRKSKERR